MNWEVVDKSESFYEKYKVNDMIEKRDLDSREEIHDKLVSELNNNYKGVLNGDIA